MIRVAANAKANSGRRDNNVGICRVRTDLVDIAVDIDGGLPASSSIHRTVVYRCLGSDNRSHLFEASHTP